MSAHLPPENTTNDVNPSSKSGGLISFVLIILLIPLLLCGVTFSIFISVIDSNAEKISKGESLYGLTFLSKEKSYNYIDPETNSDIGLILEESKKNFSFEFTKSTDQYRYQYEKEFILANLQSEYVRYTNKFDHQLDYDLKIRLSDSQYEYEKRFGQDFEFELGYAAYTTYGEILFYINPDKSYQKYDLSRMISHELVHVFQFDYDSFAFSDTPTWFYEGSADYFSLTPLEKFDSYETTYKLTNLTLLENAFLSSKADPGQSAYIVAHHFVTYLADEYSEEKLMNLMQNNDYGDFEAHFKNTYGASSDEVFDEWLNRR
jgi:hypothetical protein